MPSHCQRQSPLSSFKLILCLRMFAQRTGLLVSHWHVRPLVAPGQEEDVFVHVTHRQGKGLSLCVVGRCVIMQGAPQVAEICTLHQRAFPINDDCVSQFRFPTRCLIKMYSLLASSVFSILICWHSQNCWIATLTLGMQCLYCRKDVFFTNEFTIYFHPSPV